jgi:hypothetical protein
MLAQVPRRRMDREYLAQRSTRVDQPEHTAFLSDVESTSVWPDKPSTLTRLTNGIDEIFLETFAVSLHL